jgi:hypothetical protein
MSISEKFAVNTGEWQGHYSYLLSWRIMPLLKIINNYFIGGITALDAEVLVHDPPYVFTSPNVSWVPLFNFEACPLRARKDGRFGLEDPFQHPQMWSPKHPWTACISRKPRRAEDLELHPLKAVWWTPTQADYCLQPGSSFAELGRLTPAALKPLQDLEVMIISRLRIFQERAEGGVNMVANKYGYIIKTTFLLLKDCLSSFRDVVGQVAEFQRLILDLYAILDYITIYDRRLATPISEFREPNNLPNMCLTGENIMGCFTNDPEVASKCLISMIPVWLIREEAAIQRGIRIKRVDCYGVPSESIVVDEWCDEVTGLIRPFPTLHEGVSGVARHLAARRMGSAYADLPDLEQPQTLPSTGKTPSHSKVSPMARTTPCMFLLSSYVMHN